MMFDPDTLSALSADKVDKYLRHIELPHRYWPQNSPTLNSDLLSALQAYHLSTIPYENLALHYAKDVYISLDVNVIYQKFVDKKRGGYCMENNIFFYHLLRFFGFKVYLTGARLHRTGDGQPAGWTGWEHSVNIVTLSDQIQYLADVGYGGNGPKVPVPLISGSVVHNLGTQDLRLVRGTTMVLSDGQQGRWIYQFRNAEDQAWAVGYSFTDIEFTLKDFEVMNFFTSRSPDSFLTTKILVVKFLQEDGIITGKVILDQEQVKKNTGGKNVLLQTCQTEKERVQILENLFQLKLTEEEKIGIRGRISSLKVEV